MNQNYLNELFHWVTERESIREKRKQKMPPPWTTDTVLAQYRFCNVFREFDTVTQWIMREWLQESSPTLAFNTAVGRLVNWPDTLKELKWFDTWDPQRFIDVLASRKARGEKVWTGAYMVTGGYSAGGESKEVIIARVLSGLWAQLNTTHGHPVPGDSLEAMAAKLETPGIGTFLGAQIVADLKNTEPFCNASDWYTWCAPGPGSTMGLNFLHDRDRRASLSADQFRREVNEIRLRIAEETELVLCAQNTQNCLCELSKYIRAKYFNERLKTTYRPA